MCRHLCLQMAKMARFHFHFHWLKAHFHAGCKNNTAMNCFGPLVMLIGLPVSDMRQKNLLSKKCIWGEIPLSWSAMFDVCCGAAVGGGAAGDSACRGGTRPWMQRVQELCPQARAD